MTQSEPHLRRLVLPLTMALCAMAPAFELDRRINTWLVAGPFPAADATALTHDFLNGEAAAMPSVDTGAGDFVWRIMDDRIYCRNHDDYVDLFTWFLPEREGAPEGGNEQVFAYAHVYVWSPNAFHGQLLLGASDGLAAWLNGVRIAMLPVEMRSPVRDEHAIAIHVADGWNRLLIKSVNEKDLWGFYAKIADSTGRKVDGLAYSVDRSEGDLRITTPDLPPGFTGWPYVWQSVKDIPPGRMVPSASPFRLLAAGGAPPYSWSVVQGALPEGMGLDGAEGEFTGYCPDAPLQEEIVVRVRDSNGAVASRSLALEIRERPTTWLEIGKIGGLIHGTEAAALIHGPPEEQARLMAAQGYVFACPTTGYWPGTAEWPGWYDPRYEYQKEFGFHPPGPFLEAFNRAGVRYGSYLNVRDAMAYVYPKDNPDYRTWPRYNDFMHRYLHQWAKLARPAVLWLDGPHLPAPSAAANLGYDFDALYSIVRTVSPETLLIANSAGNPKHDYQFGDCDLFSTEGHNDKPNDCYWDRWPEGVSGLRGKTVPNESWRYPVEGQRDAREWARVVVSMIGEGHICNLDHSYTPELAKLHEQLGTWLRPRLESLQGTRPVRVESGGEWGYLVQRGNITYAHILRNKRGKAGLAPDGMVRGVQLDAPLHHAALVPGGEPVPFTQTGSRAALDLAGLPIDPVDTIVKLEVE